MKYLTILVPPSGPRSGCCRTDERQADSIDQAAVDALEPWTADDFDQVLVVELDHGRNYTHWFARGGVRQV